MNRVSEILGDKGHDVLEIEADAPVLEAVKRMVDANVGSLLVTKDGDVAGIVSERDYLRRVARDGPTGDDVTVGEIMSSKAWGPNSVIFITWDESDFTGSPTDFGFGDTRGCCDANPGGGHVLTLVIRGGHTHLQAASFTAYNHYSLLRTIEDSWHLGCLANTCDTQNVPAMSDLVDRRK